MQTRNTKTAPDPDQIGRPDPDQIDPDYTPDPRPGKKSMRCIGYKTVTRLQNGNK